MENGEERKDIVTLLDDDGSEHDFAVIDIFSLNMKQYAILVPVRYADQMDEDDEESDDEAYIFRIEAHEESGEETLVEVVDEAEWNQVAKEWESRAKEFDAEEESDLSC
ncbi:MAG: DUF1292 domain-containing protein [Dethiobacter sp.]|nr:DUF1292 domain-containing protein [Dethiobacter sp.]